ncbi:MAG: ABC transporter substrate-binding protein/permease [Verrucomicrobiota bacterium]|nr:ABC transporter substrate-binding protein/permease [Verrucomicrobiota bacterium]
MIFKDKQREVTEKITSDVSRLNRLDGKSCRLVPFSRMTKSLLNKILWIIGFFFCVCNSVWCEDTKTFTTALTGKYPPFSYYDSGGKLTGFDVDIAQEIASRLNLKSKIATTEWDGILAGLLVEKYDAIIGSMAITPERTEKVDFSNPYYFSGAQLFIHRNNPHKVYSINECTDLRIGVVLGETYQQYLEMNYPDINVVTFKSSVEIFEMLEQNRITGFVTDKLVGAWQIKKAKRPFVPVGEMLYKERIAIPVRKENTRLLSDINHALAEMEKDGTIKEIYSRYFGLDSTNKNASSKMPTSVIVKKLLKGFGVTLLVAFASILIGFTLSIPTGLLLAHKGGKLLLPHMITRAVVDLIRGIPVLIQLLFVWLGLGLRPFPAAIITLGVCAMGYMSEAVRSGLMSVDLGQGIAAKALGLSLIDRFRFIIWPQAFRIAIPSLMNCVVALIKDTALISIISIPELIREAQSIISVTFEPQKYYLIAALLFFAVTFPLMKLAGMLEKSISKKGFEND